MILSIITVNLNNCIGLERTIASVFSQSYKNFEYLIIDGGSSDGSAEIIKQCSESLTYWVSEPDNGIYSAMNKGIAKATGEYLIFLNSGDCFSDSKTIQTFYNCIKKNPTADIVYGNILVVNDTKVQKSWIKNYPEKLDLKFFRKDTINHQASLMKADLFKQFAPYPEHYKLASDYWFFLLCLLKGKEFKHLDQVLVNYDLRGITGLSYSDYLKEKQLIWRMLVPECVDEVLDACEVYKLKYERLANSRAVRTSQHIKYLYKKLTFKKYLKR